jgi:hypothetical protein
MTGFIVITTMVWNGAVDVKRACRAHPRLQTLPRRPLPPASGANAADVFRFPGAEPVDVLDQLSGSLTHGV